MGGAAPSFVQASRQSRGLEYTCTSDTKPMDIRGVQRLMLRALEAGAKRPTWMRAVWDVAGDCESSRGVEQYARPAPPSGRSWVSVPRHGTPLVVELHVRCRHCLKCLKHRRRLWAARAAAEVGASKRTWFGTLTYAPPSYFLALSQARALMRERGVRTGDKASEDRYVAKVMGRHVTLYLKRLRKLSGAGLRFIAVMEAGDKTGRLHWHLLIHEASDVTITKAQLDGEWGQGFTQWKLVETEQRSKAAAYIAKYLTKALQGRIRASQKYGQISGLGP